MSPGLYDGFEGFRSATRERQREAVRSWMVVLDTNVLLSLYNYHGRSLEDFTKVFTALGDRLFIPHQVVDEFWRNRRTVLNENRGRHRERELVEKSFDDIDSALRRWHQRVVDRASMPPPEVLRHLTGGRSAVLDHMDRKNASANIAGPDTPTHEDQVLEILDRLLRERVGPAPTKSELAEGLRQAKQRAASKVPPGYMDAAKGDERAGGDYLVWRQTMDEAARRRDRQQGVLLVTMDQKEDWWADRGTPAMRARPELVSELLSESGQALLLMRSHDLLFHSDVLGVDVNQATVTAVEEAAEEEAATKTGVGPLYQEFWKLFVGPASARGWTDKRTPSVNWLSMNAGGGGNSYGVSYAMFGCRAELYLGHRDGEVNLHRFRLLEQRRDEIQVAFGDTEEVLFDELPQAIACRIEVRNEDSRKITEKDLWQDTADWMLDRHERLRAALESVGGVPLSMP